MKLIADGYKGVSFFVEINIDRLLAPLIIVGALTVATWLVSF